jgi:tetratricopeptide (TPR) repeat protein
MERIVGEQTIPLNSSLYKNGKEQFRENIAAIIRKAKANNVDVVLSELVSNLRDQEPFISVADEKGESAAKFFESARTYEERGDFVKAREFYIKAKDHDALRFRAPEEFNVIIKELSQEYSVPLVPMISYFESEAPAGLTGSSLMLEHLHPNKEGYFLIAKAFYETLRQNKLISNSWRGDYISGEKNEGITELDSVYAALVVRHLKGSWPFQPKGLPNRFAQTFKAQNFLEDFAFKILPDDNYNLEAAHMELGKYYENRGEFAKAFNEYYALITSIPHEVDFYRKAVAVLLENKDYDKALPLLEKSLKYKKNDFAYKWIGQIALMKDDYKKAVLYLQKADLNEAQVVFNLSRACYLNKQWNKGEEYFIRLQNLDPKSRYLSYLSGLRSRTFINMKTDSLLRK